MKKSTLQKPNIKNHMVLILENDHENLYDLVLILSNYGFTVITGKNGREGLQLLYQNTPDIIIANTELPIVNGFEVLKMVRNNKRLKETPFIFTADEYDQEQIQLSRKMGADGFVKTPSSNSILYAIKRCLGLDLLIA